MSKTAAPDTSIEERLEHIERTTEDRRISASTETLEVSEAHEREGSSPP